VPYRIDLPVAGVAEFDRLVELGALDAELSGNGTLAAVMPDGVAAEQIARTLNITHVTVSPAMSRDDGSVWVIRPRPLQIGRLRIVPADIAAEPGALRLIDAAAFGTGLHPTTALCLEAIDEIVAAEPPDAVLDVGTGSGVLALAALKLGVPRAFGIDVDDNALRTAAENARLNGLDQRLQLARGGPDRVVGTWPLVIANVQAAALIDMAPTLVRRVGHQGQLMLSGISAGVEQDVDAACRRLGMRRVKVTSRTGWVLLRLQASW